MAKGVPTDTMETAESVVISVSPTAPSELLIDTSEAHRKHTQYLEEVDEDVAVYECASPKPNGVLHKLTKQNNETRPHATPSPPSSPTAGGLTRRRELYDDGGALKKRIAESNKSAGKFKTFLGIAFLYLCVEIGVGMVSGSLALMADAFHMVSDVVAIWMGYYIARLAANKRDRSQTYGW